MDVGKDDPSTRGGDADPTHQQDGKEGTKEAPEAGEREEVKVTSGAAVGVSLLTFMGSAGGSGVLWIMITALLVWWVRQWQ